MLISKLKVKSIAASLIISVAAAGTLLPGRADAKSYNWMLYTPFDNSDKPTQIYRQYAEAVKKASNGQLNITVMSAGQLPYKNSDLLQIVSQDQVQMGDVAIGPVAGQVPELNVFVLPFVCTSMDGFYKAANATKPLINKRLLSKFGVRDLMQWTMPPQEIWVSENIHELSDLKGKKIRTWNPQQVKMLRLMGAQGVPITPSEVIPALQRHVVDGAVTAVVPAYDWKFYQVLKYGYMLNFTMTNQVVAVNEGEFKALPKSLQTLLVNETNAWQGKFRSAIESAAKKAEKALESKGMTLIQPSAADFEKAKKITAPMWDEWTKGKGPIANQLLHRVTSACTVSGS